MATTKSKSTLEKEREAVMKQMRESQAKIAESTDLKKQVAIANRNQKLMAKYYSTEKRVQVRISPLYKPYFGNVMAIKLNGIPIYVPCDNAVYEIPESYAMEWASRMRKVDDQLQREKRLSDYKKNYDGQTVGGANLIKAM